MAEGETVADAAERVFPSSLVITSPGGSKAAKAADWTPLKGRPVMIWPDADAPGLIYAADVQREFAAIGAGTVTIIDAMAGAAARPSGETRAPPEGWDAADGLDEDGWRPDDLADLVLQHVERTEPAPSYVSFGKFSMNSDGLVAEIRLGARSLATVLTNRVHQHLAEMGEPESPFR